jgi:anti-sigma B factor antagonist
MNGGQEMNLSITEQREKQSIRLLVSGEIDVFTAPNLRESLLPLCQEGETVIVDLANVDYIDSTGLGVFVGAYKIQQNATGKMVLTGVNRRLLRLFRITGLEDIIEIEVQKQEDGEHA